MDGVGSAGSSSVVVVGAVGLLVSVGSVIAVGLLVLLSVTAVGLFVTSAVTASVVTTVGLFVGATVGLVGVGSSFMGADWAKNKAFFFESDPEQNLGNQF